jgi:predicted esterase
MNKRLTQIIAAILLVVSMPNFAQQIDYKGFPEWSYGKKDSTEYYLYTPSKTHPAGKYPLVLFLHGCCGQDYHATLRNAVDPPVRVWHNFGANTQREPTLILSPKTKQGWSQHIENLKFVIDSLIANKSVDRQRIYISGFSMGSGGTWEFIERYPQYFAAAIPMGMRFTGTDFEKFKQIPIWAIRGETDWWAKELGGAVATIRKMNGGIADSSDWVTGVNPRMTTFKDMGHGVMWPAVSKLNLVDWMYSKVNDGNKYPVVYFKAPKYGQEYREGEKVKMEVDARDVDGRVVRVDFIKNGKKVKSVASAPYVFEVGAMKGDNRILATAIDDKGKTATAEMMIRVDVPVKIALNRLPDTRQGELLAANIAATGNGELNFSAKENGELPDGLELSSDGMLKGIPVKQGLQQIAVVVEDEDGDTTTAMLQLKVLGKRDGEVLVKDVMNYSGKKFPLTKVQLGEMPHNGGNDEVTFSGGIEKYKGLTLIQTDANDTANAEPYYMKFEVDDDVMVYVAYEKLDNLFTSTVPDWLKDFKKEDGGQIVAQYYYYDVYSKRFPKGEVRLPDAAENKNGVNTNYFVMVGSGR